MEYNRHKMVDMEHFFPAWSEEKANKMEVLIWDEMRDYGPVWSMYVRYCWTWGFKETVWRFLYVCKSFHGFECTQSTLYGFQAGIWYHVYFLRICYSYYRRIITFRTHIKRNYSYRKGHILRLNSLINHRRRSLPEKAFMRLLIMNLILNRG